MERIKSVFDLFGAGKIWLVGGAVRDHFLQGLKFEDIKDLDFATSLSPDEISYTLSKNKYETWLSGFRYGTIACPGFQVTTLRQDEYKDSRFPKVEIVTSIEKDLQRRDFTINAMAMGPDNHLIDPFGGEEDWKKNLLRTPREASTVFNEDPLRMLRGFRFISSFGLSLDKEAYDAISTSTDMILLISKERWLMEWDKLVLGNYLKKALDTMRKSGLLQKMIPELVALYNLGQGSQFHSKDAWNHTLMVASIIKPTPLLRWAAIMHDIGKSRTRSEKEGNGVHFYRHEEVGEIMWRDIAHRFKMSNERTEQVAQLIKLHMRSALYENWSDKAVRRFRHEMGELLEEQLALSEADITSHKPERVVSALTKLKELESRLHTLPDEVAKKSPLPQGVGNLIMSILQLSPGKEVGKIKQQLEQAVVDGDIESSHKAIISRLEDMKKNRGE